MNNLLLDKTTNWVEKMFKVTTVYGTRKLNSHEMHHQQNQIDDLYFYSLWQPYFNFYAKDQLKNEFKGTPYQVNEGDLMAMANSFEKAKFMYWRAEEKRRVRLIILYIICLNPFLAVSPFGISLCLSSHNFTCQCKKSHRERVKTAFFLKNKLLFRFLPLVAGSS